MALAVLRTSRWRHRLTAQPLTAKIAAIALAAAWAVAVAALLFLI